MKWMQACLLAALSIMVGTSAAESAAPLQNSIASADLDRLKQRLDGIANLYTADNLANLKQCLQLLAQVLTPRGLTTDEGRYASRGRLYKYRSLLKERQDMHAKYEALYAAALSDATTDSAARDDLAGHANRAVFDPSLRREIDASLTEYANLAEQFIALSEQQRGKIVNQSGTLVFATDELTLAWSRLTRQLNAIQKRILKAVP